MPASPSTHRALQCPQCRGAMEALPLEGHYGQAVQTDLCPRCNLIWLDEFEAVNLSGLGWVKLLRRMQTAQEDPTAPQFAALDCPRCNSKLKQVHNMTSWGRFAELECPRCRGGLASFSLMLARRGLVRAMTRRDLDALKKESRDPSCFNCGAGLEREACARGLLDQDARCTYCESPLVVIDMPRFFTALLSRHAEAVAPERLAWPCRSCGAAVEPTHSASCETCRHPVVVPSVVDLRRLLDEAEPLLRAALPRGAKPHGQRLRELRGDHRATGLWRVVSRLKAFFESD
jgi:Zn-finger nucleic acid-binding protein